MVNAFIGKSEQPGDSELSAALGASRVLWDKLLAELSKEQLITGWEWHSYSVKAGWSLRLQRKERNILYMVPRSGGFLAAFVFGDKALAAIRAGKFPPTVMELIASARKYAEGTGVRLEVKGPKDIAIVKKLAAIKVAN
jgi:hypothetical protein